MRFSTSLYTLFLRGSGLLSGFFSVLFVSKYLSHEEAGLFFSMAATLIAFALFSRLGQDKSIIPEIVHNKQDDVVVARIISISLYPFVILSVIWILLFGVSYIWFIFIFYLLIFNNIISSYFKAKFQSNLSIIFENSFIYTILSFLLVVYLLLNNNITLKGVLWVYGLSVYFQFFIIVLLKKEWLLSLIVKIKFISVMEFYTQLIALKSFIVISYLGHLLRFMPILILMYFFSLQDLASYKIIEQIAMSSGVIIVSVNSTYGAYYAKYKYEKKELKNIVMKSFNFSFVMAICFFVFLFFLEKFILNYVQIESIRYGSVYIVFIISSFISIISAPFYNALMMVGEEGLTVTILFISVGVSILFMFVSLLLNSLFVLSLSNLFFYCTQFLFSLYFFFKSCKYIA